MQNRRASGWGYAKLTVKGCVTIERLASSPVEVWALLLGDVFASFVFGLLISIIPLAVAILMGVEVVHLLVFCLGMILATFCFASLSILLSVYPPTDMPATVMMLSLLVRFPPGLHQRCFRLGRRDACMGANHCISFTANLFH